MMKIYRILNPNDIWYAAFRSIYADSFPLHEQRNEEQQLYAFTNYHYHLNGYIQDNRLLAFIAYWDFGSYYYIEHLAVNPSCRGQSIGSRVLSDFMDAGDPQVILEIDPVTDNISLKRFHFYEHLGFIENPYSHFHPPYDSRFEPHHLTVLSAPDAISPDVYSRFKKDLEDIVMR